MLQSSFAKKQALSLDRGASIVAVNPIEVRQRDGVYRRGVLLGMTMAEIMILILFCLLMAFVLSLEEYQERIEQAEEAQQLFEELKAQVGSYDDAWTLLTDIRTVVKQLGTDALNEIAALIENDPSVRLEDVSVAVVAGLEQYNAIKAELAAETENLPSSEEVLEALGQRIADGKEYQKQSPVLEALQPIKDRLDRANGEEPSLEDFREAIRRMTADAEAWNAENQGDLAQQFQDAQIQNLDLEERIGRLGQALTKATDQLAGKGQGLVYPSCFQTEEGKIQYVFDIEFTEDSMTLAALPVPGNEERWERLNFQRISTGEAVSVARYLAETRDVFDWSKANACRFFVRILDRTLAENKRQYKVMKRNIESRFYTWESPRSVANPETTTVSL